MIDALLNELKEKAQELSNKHWGDDERHLIGKGVQCMYIQTENIIRERTKNNGWIPCSERLPETRNNILVCQRDGYVSVGYYSQDKFLDLNSYPFDNVIAWQLLPEAYHE